MKCYRCHTTITNANYCSFCFQYGSLKGQPPLYKKRNNAHYFALLNYPLSQNQKNLSRRIVEASKDVLVHAVCGAGKTEIVLTTIQKFLKKGQRIGFVTPRQVLVIDIQKRLEKIFVNNKIVKCFKNHPPLLGDIVVLTAHKIIKYINQFDLVIIDEIDAFPLSQNIVLQKMALHLAREKTIIISATPPSYLKSYDLLVLKLFQRYHQHHLPIPIFKKVWSLPQSLYRLLHKWKSLKVIVYFPTITLQKKYFAYFKDHFKVRIINSQTYNPSRILFQFINLDLNIIFATSTLERGITIKNLNVIVVAANHQLFTSEVLEQISGRVGRVINFEKGWIYFLAQRQSVAIKKCIKQIKTYNQLSHLPPSTG